MNVVINALYINPSVLSLSIRVVHKVYTIVAIGRYAGRELTRVHKGREPAGLSPGHGGGDAGEHHSSSSSFRFVTSERTSKGNCGEGEGGEEREEPRVKFLVAA